MKNLSITQLKTEEKKYNKLQNEGGEGYNPYTYEIENKREAEAMAWMEKEKQKEILEWDLETTKNRRVEFNSKKPTRATIDKIEMELGYTMFDLQNAIKRHGI